MKLRIKVKPSSKTDEIIREADGGLKVKIKAPPVEGKTNQYLINFLSEKMNVAKSKIVLLKGETAAYKTLELDIDEAVFQKFISKI